MRHPAGCASAIAALSLLGTLGVTQVVVTPTEIDDLLPNPHMGWQTFHRFASDDPALESLPSTSAYFRLYWSQIEPTEGEIDFAQLDGLLAKAHASGQKLALRIMCVGTDRNTIHVPTWLRDGGCPGFEFQYGGEGPTRWAPDMDDPRFQGPHLRLIKALGERYDGHPDLDLVDIGSVGLWGEWHMSSTGVEMPTWETRQAIIDAWCDAFPRTPKVMLIGDAQGMTYAASRGCGWRADCLGDMGGFSQTWNHMDNFYLQQLEKTGTRDAWETGPVAFESCWDMNKWAEEGWDIAYIFGYALNCHASYVNNKSARIPEGTRPEVERLLRRIGYRLVLRRLEHAESVKAGSKLVLAMQWENVGCAPAYHDYLLAARLGTAVVVTDTSVKGWLPGAKDVNVPVDVPNDAAPGQRELSLALVDPTTREPAIRLGIAGRGEDGWYPLSQVTVTR